MKKYKNYLFDFGGVLYHININNAIRNFSRFSSRKEIFDAKTPDFLINNSTIDLYEKGLLSTDMFRFQIRSDFSLNITDEDFDACWNSILLHLEQNAFDVIKKLSEDSNISLLSNTSTLHYKSFLSECADMFSFFDKLYLSFEIGFRKPDANAFQYVIDHGNYVPEETLFIDDTDINTKVAARMGFDVLKINNPSKLSDLLHTV